MAKPSNDSFGSDLLGVFGAQIAARGGFKWREGGGLVGEGGWGGLTSAAACAGADDGFIPLVCAGHGDGALVHAVFAAAEHRSSRLQGAAAVGVRSACKRSDTQSIRKQISRVLHKHFCSKT